MWGRKQVENFLKQRVCEMDRDDVFVFYDELYDLVGLSNKEDISQRQYVHNLLGEISADEAAKNRPLISVIVIRQSDYRPGPGFFDLARDHLAEEYVGQDDETIFVKEYQKLIAYKHNYCKE